jgi:hypothetical protein
MLVLVIIWMTLMDNHHVIKSKSRDCYCLVGNDRWTLVMSLGNWKWWNGLCVRILGVEFFLCNDSKLVQGFLQVMFVFICVVCSLCLWILCTFLFWCLCLYHATCAWYLFSLLWGFNFVVVFCISFDMCLVLCSYPSYVSNFGCVFTLVFYL